MFLPARLRASMHRLHWYPNFGVEVEWDTPARGARATFFAHQIPLQFTWYRKVLQLGHLWGPVGEEMHAAQIPLQFTWYRKVLLPGHLWGTSG